MFEGKIIKYISPLGNEYTGKVVACVKDIGITIVDANNSSIYLYCLIMKNAPNFISRKGSITRTRKLFTKTRKGIISGIVDRSHNYNSGMASAKTCPFGQ